MAVRLPTLEQIDGLGAQFGLVLTADEIAAFQQAFKGPLASYGRLDELVPRYLRGIPADPFRDDRKPIGYVMLKTPQGRERPMLYVEWGPDNAPRAEPVYGWVGNNGRQYRDLSIFTPASTKAVNNHPSKADAPRNQP